jgi:hypothetical protein
MSTNDIDTNVPVTPAPVVNKRRPKSPLRLQLEALQAGQEIVLKYTDKKTPFSVLMAIKRQQLGKHFVFEELTPGEFKVRIGTGAERSHSLRA